MTKKKNKLSEESILKYFKKNDQILISKKVITLFPNYFYFDKKQSILKRLAYLINECSYELDSRYFIIKRNKLENLKLKLDTKIWI